MKSWVQSPLSEKLTSGEPTQRNLFLPQDLQQPQCHIMQKLIERSYSSGILLLTGSYMERAQNYTRNPPG